MISLLGVPLADIWRSNLSLSLPHLPAMMPSEYVCEAPWNWGRKTMIVEGDTVTWPWNLWRLWKTKVKCSCRVLASTYRTVWTENKPSSGLPADRKRSLSLSLSLCVYVTSLKFVLNTQVSTGGFDFPFTLSSRFRSVLCKCILTDGVRACVCVWVCVKARI